jgi:hypothetical protein
MAACIEAHTWKLGRCDISRTRAIGTGPSHKLTAEDVAEIRERASLGHVNYEALGRRHGVTGACIKKVLLGKSWRHLLPAAAVASAAPSSKERAA